MTEQVPSRRTSPWIVWPMCLLVLVVVYVGSYGPMWGSWHRGRISDKTYYFLNETIYLPLRWTAEKSGFFDTRVGKAYLNYIGWWGR